MIELCYESLSVRCIRLHVIIMSHTRIRVNLLFMHTSFTRKIFIKEGNIGLVYFGYEALREIRLKYVKSFIDRLLKYNQFEKQNS